MIPTLITPHTRMPALGLGTWKLDGAACAPAIHSALALGYRHIDTATVYWNEAEIGTALAAAAIPRDQLFLTSKVWRDSLAPAKLYDALRASLDKLRTDYLDLYLIHWPTPDMDLAATLQAMMRAQADGLVRAIGVSNFTVKLMRQAVEDIGTPIACNQVEAHALIDQSKVLAYARAHDILISAYSPLAQGQLTDNPTLTRIGDRHNATAAQIGLKWLLDQGMAVIPKAARPESQHANLDALQITLTDTDHSEIAALPKTTRLCDLADGPTWD